MNARRPSILFILTDDQGAWTLGAEGHPNARTPVLDRLAAQGAVFTSMFANSAVCSPSRASLLTGRYPSEAGFGPDGCVFLADEERHIDPSFTSWPTALRESGYRTALIGKWHLGHGRPERLPGQNGYERFRGFPVGGEVSRDPKVEIDGVWREFPGEFTSDVLADLAIETLQEWHDQTFALSLHFWAPHANTRFPDGYEPPYPPYEPTGGKRNRSWLPLKSEDLLPWQQTRIELPEYPSLDVPYVERMAREYHASVHSVDRNVGRVLAVLEKIGRSQDTIVIFTSDQGYNMGHHGIWHKGNGWWATIDGKDPDGTYITRATGMRADERHNLYDDSLRVPAVVRWPGVVAPGSEVSRCVSFVDWFPTLLAVTGAPLGHVSGLRGRSFLPLLQGLSPAEWDDGVFAQYDRLRCYRTPEWKWIRNLRPNEPDELYDLRKDPGERRNLVAGRDRRDGMPTGCAFLDECLLERMRAIGDPILRSGQVPEYRPDTP